MFAVGPPAAGVPEDLHRLRIGLSTLPDADFRFQMPVAREHVEPTVAIVVEKEATEFEPWPAGSGEALGRSHVGKAQTSTILKKGASARLLSEIRDQDGRLPGPDLAHVDAHSAALLALGVGDTGFLGHLDEAAAALAVRHVMEEEVAHGIVG